MVSSRAGPITRRCRRGCSFRRWSRPGSRSRDDDRHRSGTRRSPAPRPIFPLRPLPVLAVVALAVVHGAERGGAEGHLARRDTATASPGARRSAGRYSGGCPGGRWGAPLQPASAPAELGPIGLCRTRKCQGTGHHLDTVGFPLDDLTLPIGHFVPRPAGAVWPDGVLCRPRQSAGFQAAVLSASHPWRLVRQAVGPANREGCAVQHRDAGWQRWSSSLAQSSTSEPGKVKGRGHARVLWLAVGTGWLVGINGPTSSRPWPLACCPTGTLGKPAAPGTGRHRYLSHPTTAIQALLRRTKTQHPKATTPPRTYTFIP